MVEAPLFLIWSLVGFAAGGATWRLVRRMWSRRPQSSTALKLVITLVAIVVALGMLGTAIGLIKALGAIGGESVDPSQKARILAEDMSGATNAATFGFLLWVAGALAALVIGRKPKQPPP